MSDVPAPLNCPAPPDIFSIPVPSVLALYRSAEERLINETNDLKKKLEANNGLLTKLAAEVEKAKQEATSSSMLTSKIQFAPPKPADKPSSRPLSGDYGSGGPHPVPGGMGKYIG